MAMLEGESRAQVQRRQDSVIRVREVDPHTQKPNSEYELHFNPGPFSWGEGESRTCVICSIWPSTRFRAGRLPVPAQRRDPEPARRPVQAGGQEILARRDAGGPPSGSTRPAIPWPGSSSNSRGRECPRGGQPSPPRTSSGSSLIGGSTGLPGGTPLPWSHSRTLIGPSWWRTFSSPRSTRARAAWPGFAIPTSRGRPSSTTCRSRARRARPSPCPDSDLKVTVEKVADFPAGEGGLFRILGEAAIPVGMFKVQKGDGPQVEHFAMASLPMVPNIMPNPRDPEAKPPQPLVSIHLMILPNLDPKTTSRMGQIEVLAGPGSVALLPGLRPRQGGKDRASRRGTAGAGQDRERLRRRAGHAHDHQLPGRGLPARGR